MNWGMVGLVLGGMLGVFAYAGLLMWLLDWIADRGIKVLWGGVLFVVVAFAPWAFLVGWATS